MHGACIRGDLDRVKLLVKNVRQYMLPLIACMFA